MLPGSDERPEVMTRTDTDEVAILELGANHRDSVHNGTVLAAFVPDEQPVFHTCDTRMVAGDPWVVDHDVVRGIATDRAEISVFEPVLSDDEVLEPQFELEHEEPPMMFLGRSQENATSMPQEIRTVEEVDR